MGVELTVGQGVHANHGGVTYLDAPAVYLIHAGADLQRRKVGEFDNRCPRPGAVALLEFTAVTKGSAGAPIRHQCHQAITRGVQGHRGDDSFRPVNLEERLVALLFLAFKVSGIAGLV